MPDVASPLDAAERARGRRLVIASHPLGMTHQRVFTAELPTLALIALGAGDAVIGLQRSFEPLLQLLRLPTLRATGRWSMRRLLLAGQVAAVVLGAPLMAFGGLRALEPATGIAFAVASLAATSAALAISQTVWFPLLYHYLEPGQTGRFFGVLRTGWHAALIVYFLAAQRWLASHPGAFGALFGVGWICGALRIALLAQLPERARSADRSASMTDWRAPFRDRRFRRYLASMSLASAARRASLPFALVWLRRDLGLTDADLAFATVALYAGGLISLYAWGIVADRAGTGPVFGVTSAVGAAATLGLVGLASAGAATLGLAVALFVLLAICTAGFEVADTNLLFRIAPPEDPAPMLVMASVAINALNGMAPLAAGLMLEHALASGAAPTAAYGALFACCAVLQLVALAPLREPTRDV